MYSRRTRYFAYSVLLIPLILLFAATVSGARSRDNLQRGRDLLAQLITDKKSMGIAHDRYAFLSWYRLTKNTDPIHRSDSRHNTLLFPIGRCDRAYVILDGADAHDVFGCTISCYQRINGKWRSVYRVSLASVTSTDFRGDTSVGSVPAMSLIDSLFRPYSTDSSLPLQHYEVKGRLDDAVINDLARYQDYVWYSFWLGQDTLQVSLLSETVTTRSNKGDLHFLLINDPTTKKPMTSEQFYDTYGLPICSQEFAHIRGSDGK